MQESFIDNLQEFGHILIYAPTNCGKTTLTKYIASKLRFTEIIIFTTSPEQYEDFQPRKCDVRVYSNEEQFKDVCKELMQTENRSQEHKQKYKLGGTNCIIFDDFNNVINVNSDEYKELFTRGRHKGIRVINIGHGIKAIGKIARNNANYVFMTSQVSKTELKELSELFSSANQLELMRRFAEINNDMRNYLLSIKKGREFVNVLSDSFYIIEESDEEDNDQIVSQSQRLLPFQQNVISRSLETIAQDNRRVQFDQLNRPSNQTNQQEGLNQEFKQEYKQRTVVNEIIPPANSTISMGEQPRYFNPISSSLNVLNKQAGRDFVDNSKNIINIEQRIKNEQKILDQSINHQLAIQNIINVQEQERLKNKFILRDLILKDPKSLKDIRHIIYLLNQMLVETEEDITMENWELFAEEFMEQCCGIRYNAQNKKQNIKNMPVSQQLTKNMLMDAPIIGQQLVDFNQSNFLDTFTGLSSIMKKYVKQL